MRSIKIQKISITDLETDVVVNAANEGLWAGGGVCGAIFRAAGHRQLQDACDRIGHCDTGSAVITPGFQLKAKYIIHAVGPVWRDGKHNEPELLYGAYRIFGYPAEQAWQTAIQACRDFLNKGNEIDIVFAALDDAMLRKGQRILENTGR